MIKKITSILSILSIISLQATEANSNVGIQVEPNKAMENNVPKLQLEAKSPLMKSTLPPDAKSPLMKSTLLPEAKLPLTNSALLPQDGTLQNKANSLRDSKKTVKGVVTQRPMPNAAPMPPNITPPNVMPPDIKPSPRKKSFEDGIDTIQMPGSKSNKLDDKDYKELLNLLLTKESIKPDGSIQTKEDENKNIEKIQQMLLPIPKRAMILNDILIVFAEYRELTLPEAPGVKSDVGDKSLGFTEKDFIYEKKQIRLRVNDNFGDWKVEKLSSSYALFKNVKTNETIQKYY